ncbi:MAG: hypothetical protein KDB23_07635 [Planctomycetales bacterium]|nr:hypothetical protein [Planctomycetales bacterium]
MDTCHSSMARSVFFCHLNTTCLRASIVLLAMIAPLKPVSAAVDLTYEPTTGMLGIQADDVGPVTSLLIVSRGGVFEGAPAFPLGHFWSHSLFYVTARAQDALPSVNFGGVVSSDLSSELLLDDFCLHGVQRSEAGEFHPIDEIRLNGEPFPTQPETCPVFVKPNTPPLLTEPRVVIAYDAATGSLTTRGLQAGGEPAAITALEIMSRSAIFTGEPAQQLGTSPWDVDTDRKLFKMDPAGFSQVDFGPVAATGLTANFVHSDLCVNGAWLGGGAITAEFAFPDAGLVPLTRCDAINSPLETGVSIAYDPVRGITVESVANSASDPLLSKPAMTTLEISSSSGIFVGQLAEHLDGPYDLQSPYRILKQDPAGFTSVELGPILQSPYSQEFLVNDLSFDITFADGQRLSHVNVLVPEPNALTLLAFGAGAVVLPALRQRQVRA